MRTLFLAWQDGGSSARTGTAPVGGTRRWFPIGRLDAEPDQHLYRFRYTHGAEEARDLAHFITLDAFPDLYRTYESPELFPLFQNRIMRPERADFPAFAERLGLSPAQLDPFTVLGITGGERQTDPLQVFPKIITGPDGVFRCRFFLHGWRHVNRHAQEHLDHLLPDEELQVAMEINNPATGAAIQLQTASDYHMLGWAPRYLVHDLLHAMGNSVVRMKARVVRMNPPPAPHNQRVLVELEGCYPEGKEPMSSADFQPVMAEAN